MKVIFTLRTMFFSLVTLLSANLNNLYGQEKFVLTKAEMPGYILESSKNIWWNVNDTIVTYNATLQRWVNDKKQTFNIEVCEYVTEAYAIKGTAWYKKSHNAIFLPGTKNGEILADNQWYTFDNSYFLFFQKWNVGVSISANTDSIEEIHAIAKKIIAKIDANVAESILKNHNKLKNKQISPTVFGNKIWESDKILKQNQFEPKSQDDSKWLLPPDSLVMGVRKTWQKGNSVYCIDMAQFSNNTEAQQAISYTGKRDFIPTYQLNYSDSLTYAIGNWFYTLNDVQVQSKYATLLGTSGNIAFKVYAFDPVKVDTLLLKQIIAELIKPVLIIKQTNTPLLLDGKTDSNDPWKDEDWVQQTMAWEKYKSAGMTSEFQLKFDSANLYLAVRVADATRNIVGLTYDDDRVNIQINLDTTLAFSEMLPKPVPYYVFWNVVTRDFTDGLSPVPNNLIVKQLDIGTGYTQEWSIPWKGITDNLEKPWDCRKFKFNVYTDNYTADAYLGSRHSWYYNSIEPTGNPLMGTVILEYNLPTNLIKREPKISLYPNPASNYLSISGISNTCKVDILSPDGKHIKTCTGKTIPVSDLKSGWYIAICVVDKQVIAKPFFKK